MAWSALIGAVSGLVGALAGILINALLASVAMAAGYSLSASLGLISLVTRPFWGLLVCGAAGLFMGGGSPQRQLN